MIEPTDPEQEMEKGRIALWLDPEDVSFLIDHSQNLPSDTDDESLRKWAVIRFRANAALHKSGNK